MTKFIEKIKEGDESLKKIILLFGVAILISITSFGCSSSDGGLKQEKIESLTERIAELEREVEEFNKEKDYFAIISSLSMEFVNAHTSGNEDKLKQILNKDIHIHKQGNKLFAKVNNHDWLLYSEDREYILDDWIIQGFEFNKKSKTYHVFIREFILNSNGTPQAPPTFLSLSFKKFGNDWKVIDLTFDL